MDKLKDLWKKSGYYVALFMLVAGLGTSAYFIRNNAGRAALPEAPAERPRQVSSSLDEIAPLSTGDKLTWPVSSRNIIAFHSPDEPVWSQTLEMYMTHDGIDIEALPGEAVVAAMEGDVVAIYSDEMMGNTIELSHEGGIRTIYSNLATINLVEIGQSVRRGEVISTVGASSRLEGAMQPHLHFEAYENGAWLDLPED
ncbi:MAG: M23 family metallopeptidase [Clostridia bacterium]|nr:M23 family metallopeptidase [Clostridia bacterium]